MADNTSKAAPKKQIKVESKEQKQVKPQAQQQQSKEATGFVRETGKGVVKAVPSGDTIIVLHLDKAHQGPPVERQITLSNIQAPLLRRRGKEAQEDEAFAWDSREFLRKKCIGKQVQYTIEFKNPSGREYGNVRLLSGEEPVNLSTEVVAHGWAKVKRPNQPPKDGQYRPEIQELINLEEEAQSAGKGIFNKDPVDIENSKRPPAADVSNPAALYEQLKGKPQTGIVENVRTGTSLKVVLLPSFNEITLYLAGVQAPEQKQDGEWEPFGRESKFFTEHHILNREVTVLLEAVDKYNCYGSVSYLGRNLAEELLKNGLARYVEWSGARTAFNEKLKEAEKVAKEKKVRMFSVEASKQAKAQQQSKGGKEISGKIVEVLPGGILTLIDSSGNDHRINLSSVRIPRLTKEHEKKEEKKEEKPDSKKDKKKETFSKEVVERAYAWEAREFLRRRLIGQRVRCVMDYSRTPQSPQPGAKKGGNQEQERFYYSVYVDKNNVAVELVEQGFAYAQQHRGGEMRSNDYEHILLAEDRANKLKRGLHGPDSKAPVLHITDISVMDVPKKEGAEGEADIAQRKRQILPFLKRGGKQRGVVEYEFSATRLKIFVPKESSMIALTLSAVRAPTRNEPFAKEAHAFVRDVAHQHDVEFEVLSLDRGGTFIGNVWVNKKNLATLLLEQGFAEISGGLKENDNSTEYLIAEESAKRGKKNIWKNYDAEAEAAAQRKRKEENEEKRKSSKTEFPDVVVTEVLDGSRFYAQLIGPEAEQLDELMKNLSVETSDEPYKGKVGELVKAQFIDDAWYRAKIEKITPEGEFEVFYIDYGNSEVLPSSRLRPLDPSFVELSPQAKEGQLAYIKTPKLSEDYGTDAAMYLKELVAGKPMMASLEYKDNDRLFLSLIDRESQVFVNAAMLRAGYARVEKPRFKQAHQFLEKLREEEDKARRDHLCIWEYGDPGSDEEDDRETKDKKLKGKV